MNRSPSLLLSSFEVVTTLESDFFDRPSRLEIVAILGRRLVWAGVVETLRDVLTSMPGASPRSG